MLFQNEVCSLDRKRRMGFYCRSCCIFHENIFFFSDLWNFSLRFLILSVFQIAQNNFWRITRLSRPLLEAFMEQYSKWGFFITSIESIVDDIFNFMIKGQERPDMYCLKPLRVADEPRKFWLPPLSRGDNRKTCPRLTGLTGLLSFLTLQWSCFTLLNTVDESNGGWGRICLSHSHSGRIWKRKVGSITFWWWWYINSSIALKDTS